MDAKILISIRSKAINSFIADNISPEDVIFYVKNGNVGQLLLPYKGDFPPSYKYNIRKIVLQKILERALSDAITDSEELFFCSYDFIYNVDYIYKIDMRSNNVTLYVARDGNTLRRFQNYQLDFDERIELANL